MVVVIVVASRPVKHRRVYNRSGNAYPAYAFFVYAVRPVILVYNVLNGIRAVAALAVVVARRRFPEVGDKYVALIVAELTAVVVAALAVDLHPGAFFKLKAAVDALRRLIRIHAEIYKRARLIFLLFNVLRCAERRYRPERIGRRFSLIVYLVHGYEALKKAVFNLIVAALCAKN